MTARKQLTRALIMSMKTKQKTDLSEENLISNAAIEKGICKKSTQFKSMNSRTARTYAVKNGYTLEKVGKYIYQDSVVSMGDNVL